jgi:hypothetical protein
MSLSEASSKPAVRDSQAPSRASGVAPEAGPAGNQRLTAITGAVLLILLSAEVMTTLSIENLFGLHFFLGMVLIGPVCLKIGSTVWRFTRYYTGSAPYVRRGPPPMPQRVLGPLLILTSAGVLGTGVMLAVSGPVLWILKLHQRIFYLWLIVVIIHVVYYLPKLPRLLASHPADQALRAVTAGRRRWLLLAASLILGLILAVLTYHLRFWWPSPHRLIHPGGRP